MYLFIFVGFILSAKAWDTQKEAFPSHQQN